MEKAICHNCYDYVANYSTVEVEVDYLIEEVHVCEECIQTPEYQTVLEELKDEQILDMDFPDPYA